MVHKHVIKKLSISWYTFQAYLSSYAIDQERTFQVTGSCQQAPLTTLPAPVVFSAVRSPHAFPPLSEGVPRVSWWSVSALSGAFTSDKTGFLRAGVHTGRFSSQHMGGTSLCDVYTSISQTLDLPTQCVMLGFSKWLIGCKAPLEWVRVSGCLGGSGG